MHVEQAGLARARGTAVERAAADPDVALMLKVQSGDETAFQELFQKFSPRVLQYARRLVGSDARAEELTQDVFVRCWEKLATFRGESAFGSWLYRLAVNVVWMANRGDRRREERVVPVPEPDLHLRPAFQQHQYDTVSAFRRDRTVGGATVPIPAGWPDSTAVAEPGTPTTDDSTGPATAAFPDAGSGAAAYPAHARPVPVPPAASETITNRGATVTPLSPTPTRPFETPPGTRKTPRPVPGPTPSRPAQPRRRPRRARLRLSRVDPWSVTKIALLFSIAMAITTLITVSLLWGVLNLMGVFTDVGQTVNEVTGSNNGGGVDVETMLSLSRVLKFTTIIVVLQAIVLTCLATLAAFLYNASSGLVGGVEITLSEAE